MVVNLTSGLGRHSSLVGRYALLRSTSSASPLLPPADAVGMVACNAEHDLCLVVTSGAYSRLVVTES